MPTDTTHTQAHAAIQAVRDHVHKNVVGYDGVVDDLLIAYITGGHVLLEGVPGIAKTTLAKAFANALSLTFRRVQFTPDVLPSDVTGHFFFNQKTVQFEFREGPIFANLVLGDEINRAGAKTQSALLEAMQEVQVTVEGRTYPLPDPFFVIATQNPIDVEGVYTLPAAQLDRFMLRSRLDYLPRQGERSVLARRLEGTLAVDAGPGIGRDIAGALRSSHENVHVDATIVEYILDVAVATRTHEMLKLGASTRAALHLMQAAQARALLEDRDYVIPDDVKRVAPNVLAHRLSLTVDAELDEKTPFDVLAQILDAVPVPSVTTEAR